MPSSPEAAPPNLRAAATETAGRPGGDGPGAPSAAMPPVSPVGRAQVLQQAQAALARLTRLRITDGGVPALLNRLRRHARDGATNAEVARLFPIVFDGIQNPRLISEVTADIWAEARRVTPVSYNDAAVRLSARAIGGRVEDVVTIQAGQNLAGDAFFTRYAGTGQRFLDLDAPRLHGATTHLIQDLVVDRALREAGETLRAEQFRALLPRVNGQGVNIPIGDEVWRALWDADVQGAINEPERLFAALRQILEGLR